MKFKCRATSWGCEHEKEAQEAYVVKATKSHIGFKLSPSGLMIHLPYPHLAATPDGVIRCDCCGPGVVEIKCPYHCKFKTIKDACVEKSFCLEERNGELLLKKSHSYYY